MKLDFDTIFDRPNIDSLMWDKYKGKDVIPLWIADMNIS